jgi:hypothetical protein
VNSARPGAMIPTRTIESVTILQLFIWSSFRTWLRGAVERNRLLTSIRVPVASRTTHSHCCSGGASYPPRSFGAETHTSNRRSHFTQADRFIV